MTRATKLALSGLIVALSLALGMVWSQSADAYDPIPSEVGSCRLVCEGDRSTWLTGSGAVASCVDCAYKDGCCTDGVGCAQGHCRRDNAAPTPPAAPRCR